MNNWLHYSDDGSLDPLVDNFQTDCYGFVYKITNLETGKVRKVNIDFKAMGRKSVKVRHAGKSKKEISNYYRELKHKGIKG